MTKSLLVATTTLALMMGGAFAQTSSSSTTTETTTAAPAVAPDVSIDRTSKRVTSDRNGVTVEKDESGTSTTAGPVVPRGEVETRSTTTTTGR